MRAFIPMVSHTTLLLIGLIAVSLIVVSISSSFSETEKNLIKSELDYIAESAKNKILEIYSMANQSMEYSNASFRLNLPQNIGNKKYLLSLDNQNLTVTFFLQNENIEVGKTLNIDAQLGGEAYMPASIIVENVGGSITMDLVG